MGNHPSDKKARAGRDASVPAGMKNLDSNHNLLIRQRSRGMQILNAGNRRNFSEVRLFRFSEKCNKSALQKQPPTHRRKGLEKGNPLWHINGSYAWLGPSAFIPRDSTVLLR
jgi:hypothetical protein